MMTFPVFHTTISAKELRPNMPPVPFLLSATSFLRQDSKGHCSLRKPRYLPASMLRGADCGGFTAAIRWEGSIALRGTSILSGSHLGTHNGLQPLTGPVSLSPAAIQGQRRSRNDSAGQQRKHGSSGICTGILHGRVHRL
jgi:hypothetical protein